MERTHDAAIFRRNHRSIEQRQRCCISHDLEIDPRSLRKPVFTTKGNHITYLAIGRIKGKRGCSGSYRPWCREYVIVSAHHLLCTIHHHNLPYTSWSA